MLALFRAWFTRQFFVLSLACLAFASPAMAAQPSALSCGMYESQDGSKVHLFTADLMFKVVGGAMPALMRYTVADGKLHYAELGRDDPDNLSIEDGKMVDKMWRKEYALRTPEPCGEQGLPAPATAAGQSCWKDLITCKDDVLYTASPAELNDMCRDYLPFACQFIMVTYQLEAIKSMSDLPTPVPQDVLDALVASCRGGLSADVCHSARESLWASGQYLQAGELAQHACTARFRDAAACKHAEGMAGLTQEALSTPVAGVPVGVFKSRTGINDELNFDADGKVTMGLNQTSPARLEDGLIRMRHNQGGDFVVRRVGEDMLIGMDKWNEMAVYRRQESAP